MIESNYFSEQTKLVADFFEKWHNELKINSVEKGQRSRYCLLYDAFEDRERKELEENGINDAGRTSFHNCIGCNFEEGCLNILDFVKQFAGTEKVRTYLTIYSLLFYTLAERLAVVYHELGVVNGKKFDWSQFPILRNIKHWANFFKHPKAYMFLHHPDYFLEKDPDRPNFMIEGEVDSSFVDLFYRAGADNEALRQLLGNKKGWKVIFPDLLLFTKDLCKEVDNAFDFILKSENIEKLRPFTLKDY